MSVICHHVLFKKNNRLLKDILFGSELAYTGVIKLIHAAQFYYLVTVNMARIK